MTITSRLRFSIFLALSVVVWSDAAFSTFLFPHTTSCHQGAAVAQTNASAEDSAESDSSQRRTMPCCPVQSSSSAQCGAAPVSCCVLHQGGPGASAIIVGSGQSRSKWAQAVLTATITETTLTTARSPLLEHDSRPTYAKPVNQK